MSIIGPCEETEERKVQSMSCSVCQTRNTLQEVEGLCNMKKMRYNPRGGVINMDVKITNKQNFVKLKNILKSDKKR